MLIRIATRKSALALWQAEHVADRLRELDEVDDVELMPLSFGKILRAMVLWGCRSLSTIGMGNLFMPRAVFSLKIRSGPYWKTSCLEKNKAGLNLLPAPTGE